MQDEVNEKVVAVGVKAAVMTEEVLRKAAEKALEAILAQKDGGRPDAYKGKISIKKLAKDGSEISNINISDKNIRSFEKKARKYGVTYSLKKDKAQEPPTYIVFFKMKQMSQLEAAFREYTAKSMDKERKPSVRERLLKKIKEKSRQGQTKEPVLHRPKQKAR